MGENHILDFSILTNRRRYHKTCTQDLEHGIKTLCMTLDLAVLTWIADTSVIFPTYPSEMRPVELVVNSFTTRHPIYYLKKNHVRKMMTEILNHHQNNWEL
jgi:transposase